MTFLRGEMSHRGSVPASRHRVAKVPVNEKSHIDNRLPLISVGTEEEENGSFT